MRNILLAVLLALTASALCAQGSKTPDLGLVTISEAAPLNDAIQILEIQAVRLQSKKILNLSNYAGPIGIPLNSIPLAQALEMIALKNNLVIQEKPGYIAFANPETPENPQAAEADALGINTKQVRINAIALVADRAYLKSLGIDWSTVFDGKVTVNADFGGASQVPSSLFGIGADTDFSINGTQIEISTLVKAIESNQKGSVIAKPNIIVNSGKQGFIQVGQDISVKAVDEAGNTTDTFFATGVIMQVNPTVVTVGGDEVIHLVVSIERSSGTPGNVSTIINRSKSDTELVLYDGEEIVIGGLYDTDTIRTRGGIPILKDLPWWVLGLRYLTGYDKYEVKERELVIFLKADIIENALDRAKAAKPGYSPLPEEAGEWNYLD